jgi:hypothetical protein
MHIGSLRRYTSILAVLDTLKHGRISLLNPETWSDRNDRDLMARYASTRPGRKVFAYCLAMGDEAAHHWQVFADRGFGACIVFDKARLIGAIEQDNRVTHGDVGYVNWRDLPLSASFERLPLIKRRVYRSEKEYRLVATPPASHNSPTYDIPIPLTCITSIAVSGEVPAAHFETFKAIVRGIPGSKSIRIRHSGLLQNPRWASALRDAMATRP